MKIGQPVPESNWATESKSGWPSFFEPIEKGEIVEKKDSSAGMIRTEVIAKTSGAHLGHLFDDGFDYDKGKQTPRKVGMAPVQREGMEYEFTVMLDIDMHHVASASKDRTSLFDGQFFKVTSKTGEVLLEWLETGIEPPKVELITQDQVTVLTDLIKELKADADAYKTHIGVASLSAITAASYPKALAVLERKRAQQTAEA